MNRRSLSGVVCAAVVGSATLLAIGCHRTDLSGPFRQACRDALSRPVEKSAGLVHGQNTWVFTRGELVYSCAGKFWGAEAAAANPKAPPERADPMPAILHFQRQLAAHNIELLFVPLPPRQEIYPESVFSPEQMEKIKRIPRVDPYLGEFLEALKDEGVWVFDATALLLQHRNDEQGPLFLRSDPHLTPYAIELMAGALAKKLKQSSWYDGTPKSRFVEQRGFFDYRGPMWHRYRKATGHDFGTVEVAVRSIAKIVDNGEQYLEAPNPTSPILILGDSQTHWWDQEHSSFFEQLSYELGFPVNLIMTSGGGANNARLELARLAREDPGTLARIHTVVWYFSAIALANEPGGWLNIPLPTPESPSAS